MLRRSVTAAAFLLAAAGLPAQTARQRDSVAAARYVAKVRRQEAIFFWEWRAAYKNLRDLKGTDPRYWSLHCHYDDFLAEDANHVVTTPVSRKSMCPIWFQFQGERGDESLWIDNAIPAKSRPKIHDRRARIIAMLDTAAHLDAKNGWVTLQRVRLLVDQREFDRAMDIATSECAISRAVCAMLEAYALTSRGLLAAGTLLYDFAVTTMTPAERCGFLDVSFLLDQDSRDKYAELSCPARRQIDATYWWLSDPLFLRPGNERLAAHLHRQTILIMHSGLTADEHFDYRPSKGGLAVAEMITRYGWPSVQFYQRIESDNHNGWLGFRDSAEANASREYTAPRYHTTPEYAEALDLRRINATSFHEISARWDDKQNTFDPNWWPLEHFERPGPLDELDYQSAVFRRASGPFLAVAMDGRDLRMDSITMKRYTNGIASMRSLSDTVAIGVDPARLRATGAFVTTADLNPGLQVVSAELVDADRDSAPAFRARFAVDAPPGLDSLATVDLAMSDIVLFEAPQPADSMIRVARDVIERMLPSADLGPVRRIGLFFELYGIAPNEPVDITIGILPNSQPGLFRRLGSRAGVVRAGTGSLLIRWSEDRTGSATTKFTIGKTPAQARSIILDLSTLSAGKYAIEIGAARPGRPGAVSRKEFVVSR